MNAYFLYKEYIFILFEEKYAYLFERSTYSYFFERSMYTYYFFQYVYIRPDLASMYTYINNAARVYIH